MKNKTNKNTFYESIQEFLSKNKEYIFIPTENKNIFIVFRKFKVRIEMYNERSVFQPLSMLQNKDIFFPVFLSCEKDLKKIPFDVKIAVKQGMSYINWKPGIDIDLNLRSVFESWDKVKLDVKIQEKQVEIPKENFNFLSQ